MESKYRHSTTHTHSNKMIIPTPTNGQVVWRRSWFDQDYYRTTIYESTLDLELSKNEYSKHNKNKKDGWETINANKSCKYRQNNMIEKNKKEFTMKL